MLKALRDRTTPGEPAVVLAWRDITDAIPAYRSTLSPVLFREGPNDSQRRDADRFFGSTFVTDAHLDILNNYQVNYLIVSGDREFVSQFDHLPEYFQPLYRNSYGALYRVDLPLEPNTLIEANTIANYGEWDSAIKAYNAVLEDDPNNSLAHTGLGIILELVGKPRQAVREFEAAVNASPVNAQAHCHLVNLYRKLGMDEEAAKHVQPAGRLMENSHTWNLGK
jgi:tetratricopeptide (TPR) repeat protein